MSRIGDIRAGLATVLAGVTGIHQALAYPPASISVNGTAWVGFFDTAVTDSPRTVDLHTVPVTVCVNLNSRHAAGLEATEPLIDAIRVALRTNQSLGVPDAVSRVQVTRVQQGVWQIGGSPEYVGFQLTLQIKESYGVSFG